MHDSVIRKGIGDPLYRLFVVKHLKKINLKSGNNFHPINKRLAPYGCLPCLNAGSIRLSFKYMQWAPNEENLVPQCSLYVLEQ